jgi:ubiquinone/menaquinone biosynthesis C-methylase UbiE
MSQIAANLYHQFKTYFKQRVVKTQLEWTSWNENALFILRKNAINFKPRNVLDIGFGSGHGIDLIANFFNTDFQNVYGVDIRDSSITACQEKFNAIKMDLEKNELPFRDNTFDLVICNQVLEHLISYTDVMNDAIRVTSRGGYILFGIPNLSHLINRIFLLFGIQPMCIAIDGPHIRGFTHKSFIKLLRSFDKADLVDFTGTLMYPLPYFLANIMSKHFVGLTGYTCYLLRKKE